MGLDHDLQGVRVPEGRHQPGALGLGPAQTFDALDVDARPGAHALCAARSLWTSRDAANAAASVPAARRVRRMARRLQERVVERLARRDCEFKRCNILGHAKWSDGFRTDAQGNSVIKGSRQDLKRRVSPTRAVLQKSIASVLRDASSVSRRAYAPASEGQTITSHARRVAAIDKGALRVSSSHIASCSANTAEPLYTFGD